MKTVFENQDFIVEEHEKGDRYDGLTVTGKREDIEIHIQVTPSGVDVTSEGNYVSPKNQDGQGNIGFVRICKRG